MSRVARIGGVVLSVAAHVGVGALLLSLSVMDWSQPLFVDLTERGDAAGGRAGAAGGPQPSERPAKAAVPAPRSAPAPTRAAPSPVSPAPTPPALMAEPDAFAEPVPSRDVLPPPSSSLPLMVPDLSDQQALLGTSPSPGPAASPRPGASDSGLGQAVRGAADGAGLAPGARGGDSGGIPPEYGPYLRRFRERVQESLVFPLAARRQGLHGTVELDVWLDPAGRVREVRMARSSSHTLLDEAAVTTVRQLAPLPFPESLPRRILAIRLPLVFDLR
jgi:periplasmic protein TonB